MIYLNFQWLHSSSHLLNISSLNSMSIFYENEKSGPPVKNSRLGGSRVFKKNLLRVCVPAIVQCFAPYSGRHQFYYRWFIFLRNNLTVRCWLMFGWHIIILFSRFNCSGCFFKAWQCSSMLSMCSVWFNNQYFYLLLVGDIPI